MHIYSNLRDDSDVDAGSGNSIYRSIFAWGTTIIIVYILILVCGFMTFGAEVDSDILISFLQDSRLQTNSLIHIGGVGYAFAIMCALPVWMSACRNLLLTIIIPPDPLTGEPTSPSTLVHVSVTFCLVFFPYCLALLVEDFGAALSIVGSTTTPFVSFILPTIFFCKTSPEKTIERGIALVLTVFFAMISMYSLYETIGSLRVDL